MSRIFSARGFIFLVLVAACLGAGTFLAIRTLGSENLCTATNRTDAQPFAGRTGSMGTDASIFIDLDCADARITAQAGSDWSLAGQAIDGIAPTVEAVDGRLTIRSISADGTPTGQGGSWQMAVATEPITTLELAVHAGALVADLPGAHVPRATVSANGGEAEVDLAGTIDLREVFATANGGTVALSLPATDVTGDLAVNAGAIRICVPVGAGVRFAGVLDETASKWFEDAGLVLDDGAWTTRGFATATTHLDFSVRATGGGIELLDANRCTR